MTTVQNALIGQKVALLNSYVIGQTMVDGYLLVEDDQYLALMTKELTNQTPMEQIAETLVQYVNSNY